MPKSKVRKKDVSTPQKRAPAATKVKGPSHPIYIGVMLTMAIIGLLWLIVQYIAGPSIPFMAELGGWNFAIGFAFMVVALVMTMRWR